MRKYLSLALVVAYASIVVACLLWFDLSAQSVPNHFDVVQAVYDRGGFDLTTKAGDGRFVEAVAIELHRLDPGFGHLRKPEGRTHVVDAQGNRHAADAVLYLPTGQSVDLVASSDSPAARPSWTPDVPRYTKDDWYAPVDVTPPQPPERPPVPTPACPDVDLAPLLARLAQLEAQLAVHAAAKAPIYRTSLWGASVVLRPDPK